MTFSLSTWIDVQTLDDTDCDSAERRLIIRKAVLAALAEEAKAGTERQWSTDKVDGKREFSIDWTSIEEKQAHMCEDGSNSPDKPELKQGQ